MTSANQLIPVKDNVKETGLFKFTSKHFEPHPECYHKLCNIILNLQDKKLLLRIFRNTLSELPNFKYVLDELKHDLVRYFNDLSRLIKYHIDIHNKLLESHSESDSTRATYNDFINMVNDFFTNKYSDCQNNIKKILGNEIGKKYLSELRQLRYFYNNMITKYEEGGQLGSYSFTSEMLILHNKILSTIHITEYITQTNPLECLEKIKMNRIKLNNTIEEFTNALKTQIASYTNTFISSEKQLKTLRYSFDDIYDPLVEYITGIVGSEIIKHKYELFPGIAHEIAEHALMNIKNFLKNDVDYEVNPTKFIIKCLTHSCDVCYKNHREAIANNI